VASARVRDKDIDGPELAFDLLASGLDLLKRGQLGDDLYRATAGSLDLGRDLAERGTVASVDGDRGPFLCELLGDRSPDPAGASRHERNLALQGTHGATSLSRFAHREARLESGCC
jgi:hypothetical protein